MEDLNKESDVQHNVEKTENQDEGNEKAEEDREEDRTRREGGEWLDVADNMADHLNVIVHKVLSRPGSGINLQADLDLAAQEYLKGSLLISILPKQIDSIVSNNLYFDWEVREI